MTSPSVVSPKLAASVFTSSIAGLVVWSLNKYLHADIPADQAVQIAAILGGFAGWIAPHSQVAPPTDQS